jgi:hypothetical protein
MIDVNFQDWALLCVLAPVVIAALLAWRGIA